MHTELVFFCARGMGSVARCFFLTFYVVCRPNSCGMFIAQDNHCFDFLLNVSLSEAVLVGFLHKAKRYRANIATA